MFTHSLSLAQNKQPEPPIKTKNILPTVALTSTPLINSVHIKNETKTINTAKDLLSTAMNSNRPGNEIMHTDITKAKTKNNEQKKPDL